MQNKDDCFHEAFESVLGASCCSGSPLSSTCVQVCQVLAAQPVWQTPAGQMVQLKDGCLLEALESVLGAMGPAAMALIQRAF